MEEQLTDDQSHYEISLTAGQAFVAFVLMLLSLAASFAFGLTIGKGQLEERLAGKKDTASVAEARVVPMPAPKKDEVAVADDDFKPQAPPPVITVEPAKAEPAKAEPSKAGPAKVEPAKVEVAKVEPKPQPKAVVAPAPAPSANPAYAQLLSTTDQKTAEALAAKLIDAGFTSAYVERTTTDKGNVFRVRVKFPSDAEAHVAEARLRTYSKDVWITR